MSTNNSLPVLSTLAQAEATSGPDISGPSSSPLYQFSVAQYHAMIEAGIIGKEDKVELLEGWVTRKNSGNQTEMIRLINDLINPESLTASQARGVKDFAHLPLYRFSVNQYHAMARADILGEIDRVELLEGLLVYRMTIKPPHTFATENLRDLLPRSLPPGYFVNSQQPVTTSDSEPEPDLAVVRGFRRDYQAAHPGPQQMALVVEVADSSLLRDRRIKQRLYARASIAVFWIVNLVDRQVEVYTDPTGPGADPTYRNRQNLAEHAFLPIVIDGIECGRIAIADLLSLPETAT